MFVLAAAAASSSWAITRKLTLGKSVATLRTNYAGRKVDLSGGIALSAGLAVACLGQPNWTKRTTAFIFCAGSAVLGALDDGTVPPPQWISSDMSIKGLRGHVRAAAGGELTTGFVKLLGIPALALTVEGIAWALGDKTYHSCKKSVVRAVARAATANLLNLLDLRPGRALKVGGALLVIPALVSVDQRGSALAGLPVLVLGAIDDLQERTMLGDCGANALGAYVGTSLAQVGSPLAAITALCGSALILISEKVSFTRVIDSVSLLRWLDRLGARPR